MFKKKRPIRPALSVTKASLYRLIKTLPEWRIRHRLDRTLNNAMHWSIALMGGGFVGLVLAHPFGNRFASVAALGIYALGLLVYLSANLVLAGLLVRHFLRADRVVTRMLDGLWRRERRRLRQLASGPINMAAARARWLKVQAQVLDRRVAFVTLFGAGILAASKVLDVYVCPLVPEHWQAFIKVFPHAVAFSGAIPALHFHSLATKLVRLEHQVSEVASARPSEQTPVISAMVRARLRHQSLRSGIGKF